MIKLGICGAGGRMGHAIYELAQKDKGIETKGLVEASGSFHVGKNLDGLKISDQLESVVSLVDAIIDFTTPASTLQNAQIMAKSKKAYIIGTTGFKEDEKKELIKILASIPAVLSPNMSLSANVMFNVVETVARSLLSYDAEISEVHHNLKKDSPSGTAQRLAESVQKGKAGGEFVYGRHGLVGARQEKEIGVHALRGGDVVGDHTVFFFGNGERVELKHQVTSRTAFANGAITAAKWVIGKPAGLYDMRDVLGLPKE